MAPDESRQDAWPRVPGVAGQVDGDIDLVLFQHSGDLCVGQVHGVDQRSETGDQNVSRAVIVRAKGQRNRLETALIVMLEHTCRDVRSHAVRNRRVLRHLTLSCA